MTIVIKNARNKARLFDKGLASSAAISAAEGQLAEPAPIDRPNYRLPPQAIFPNAMRIRKLRERPDISPSRGVASMTSNSLPLIHQREKLLDLRLSNLKADEDRGPATKEAERAPLRAHPPFLDQR
ncbi:hypothetical protein Plhal304r1_c032g0102951 [Plasmopara halstedii]